MEWRLSTITNFLNEFSTTSFLLGQTLYNDYFYIERKSYPTKEWRLSTMAKSL